MVPVLNGIGVHTACYGNHDFDFGVENLEDLAGKCEFPWLMSNVASKETSQKLAGGLEYRMFDWAGRSIGLIGLVEYEWMATLATISGMAGSYTGCLR